MTARKNDQFQVPPYSMEGHRLAFEPVQKRIRVKYNHKTVADSNHVRLLLETGRVPVYYFPEDDLRTEFLTPSDHQEHTRKGTAVYWDLSIAGRSAPHAIWAYPDSPLQGLPDLRGYRAFQWEAVDHWYVEDEEVFGHPRDPYTRIDIHQSSRHIIVEVKGTLIAESHRPLILFETGLRPRYYLPMTDVQGQHLVRSSRSSRCPYKGLASYWHIKVDEHLHKDQFWSYLSPLREARDIGGMFSFYQEKIDRVTIDGNPVK